MGAADESQSQQTGGAEHMMGRLCSSGVEGLKTGLTKHYRISRGLRFEVSREKEHTFASP